MKIKAIGWTKVSKKDQKMSDVIYGRSCWVNEKAACFSQYDVHVFIVVSVMLWKNKKTNRTNYFLKLHIHNINIISNICMLGSDDISSFNELRREIGWGNDCFSKSYGCTNIHCKL